MNNFNDDLLDIFFSLGIESNEANTLAKEVSKEIILENKNNEQKKPDYATIKKLYDRQPVMINGEQFYFPIITKE